MMTRQCGRGCSSICGALAVAGKIDDHCFGKLLYVHVDASFVWLVAHVQQMYTVFILV